MNLSIRGNEFSRMRFLIARQLGFHREPIQDRFQVTKVERKIERRDRPCLTSPIDDRPVGETQQRQNRPNSGLIPQPDFPPVRKRRDIPDQECPGMDPWVRPAAKTSGVITPFEKDVFQSA